MYQISQKSPLVAPMFDFKIGFLAKFCVIEGVSEIMYIYTYLGIHSYRRFMKCPLFISPAGITSGHMNLRILRIYNMYVYT